jgi:hypothetical protein
MRIKPFIVAAGAASGVAAAAGTAGVVIPWYRRWGRDESEATRSLAGDELIAEVSASDTRAITIAAPPERIWPWLVQMGYGRAGWYSYDRLDADAPSAHEIRPSLQSIAPGDVMPTHPGGGFIVRIVRPNEALVLSIDGQTMRRQAESADGRQAAESASVPTGLQASGLMLGTQPRDFTASWAFVLEGHDGNTRLIERFRISFGEPGPVARLTGPIVGFGVFLMLRRQLLGIRSRAEGPAVVEAETPTAAPPPSEPGDRVS